MTAAQDPAVVDDEVVADAESVADADSAVEGESTAPADESDASDASDASDENDENVVEESASSRFTIPRFTIPTLTIPTLSLPKWGRSKEEPDAATATDATAATSGAERQSTTAAEADPATGSEAATDTDPETQADTEAEALARVVVSAAETSTETSTDVLVASGLRKLFDDTVAVESLDLVVPRGSFYGIVGPNGAGKTTTLSMITGLLRPESGTVLVNGADVWTDPIAAKRTIGVLPDRLRLFDRLTGAQLLHYSGLLRGLPAAEVTRRTTDLARVFGLEEALGRLVSDYSAGMTKQIALAAAMIHSPRLLVLDEPFESVDPVSAERVIRILQAYVAEGGTVLLSSHSMELVERICDRVAVIVGGAVLADGTIDEVRDGRTLEERFVELAGAGSAEGLEWLHSFSD